MKPLVIDNFIIWCLHHKGLVIKVIVMVMAIVSLLNSIGIDIVGIDFLYILQFLVLFDCIISVISYLDRHGFVVSHHEFIIEVYKISVIGLCKGTSIFILYVIILFINHIISFTVLPFNYSYILVTITSLYILYITRTLISISFMKPILGKLYPILEKYLKLCQESECSSSPQNSQIDSPHNYKT